MKLILAGKQMSVSIRRATLSMELIVRRNIKNFSSPKLTILMLKLKKISKMTKNLLELQEMPNSQKLLKKLRPTKRLSPTEEPFQTINFHKH